MKKGILLLLIPLLMGGCTVKYGMLDPSIDADTFSVAIFEEQAANAPAGYGINFTDFLKDFVISRTRLDLINTDADLEVYGKIIHFNTSPVSVQSNESAALSRLTVTMAITVINNVNEEQSFESNFTQFSDFDASQDLAAVQTQLLEEINTNIAQNFINKLTSNW